ncbi:MAG: Fic family protein [Chlamydiales bacterium]|nr:Fic family protein [Chlamydiales bacterium]
MRQIRGFVPKKSKNEWFQSLLDIVAQYPEGATIGQIMDQLGRVIPRRTVQRYLSLLIDEGSLISEGKLKGRKYRLRSNSLGSDQPVKRDDGMIPLSSEGRLILEAIAQPIQLRSHVNYNKEFLDSYRPNVTYYLPTSIRKNLYALGDSGEHGLPAGTYARKIYQRLLIDLSWNSSRLEGNTYSLLETERLLEFNEPSLGKNLEETQMILNHKAAIEFLIESPTEIDRFTMMNLHALLSNNLLGDPAACGRLRSIPVGISSTVYLPTAIPQLIEECFDLALSKAKEITDPFEQAFFLMVHLPYLQPFEDVNKRVSRLAANIPLVQKNLCPLSFVDVPESVYVSGLLGIYELNQVELLRDVFVWAYERSCSLYAATRKTIGEPDPFRMRYRNEITQIVKAVVHLCIKRKDATKYIQQQVEKTSCADKRKLAEVVERELMGLHEGNIARYKISLEEYRNWAV